MTPLPTCPGCGEHVLPAVDFLTGDTVEVNPRLTPGGRVELRRLVLAGPLVAIDHITTPAPQQPAYELHSRTCTNPPPAAPVDLSDDPAVEQSKGWRR